jgi:dihydroflavonol-4-reductase
MYYRLTKTKPRFTPYSLETLASNSVISFDKSKRELGYSPRPLHESLADTIHWFRQNKPLLQA